MQKEVIEQVARFFELRFPKAKLKKLKSRMEVV